MGRHGSYNARLALQRRRQCQRQYSVTLFDTNSVLGLYRAMRLLLAPAIHALHATAAPKHRNVIAVRDTKICLARTGPREPVTGCAASTDAVCTASQLQPQGRLLHSLC